MRSQCHQVRHIGRGLGMNVEQKAALLALKPIDDEVYLKHLKNWYLLGKDVDQFKYYKYYKDQPYFYTVDYLKNTPLDELLRKDVQNKKFWDPPFFQRIKNKVEDYFFVLYLRFMRMKGLFKLW